jgi:hypothetical protein
MFAQPKFQPGNNVWLTKPGSSEMSGPYLISSMASPGTYKLCYEDGTTAENGVAFGENLLSFVE